MHKIATVFRKKWARLLTACVVIILLCWVFKIQILRGIGNYLIINDSDTKCEVLFVLGGSSLERGLAAFEVHERGLCDRMVCTGGNIPSVLAAIDTALYEADITRNVLISNGVDPSRIEVLQNSTSTWEEAEEIHNYAVRHKLSHIGIMSSKHHLRRVKKVFTSRFDESTIRVDYYGAKSLRYDESNWWRSEEGLIMVNNEYMKLIYYLFKY